MGLYLLNCQPNLLLYRFYLLKNLIVPKSEHAETSRLQYLRAILVILCPLSMLSPIYLDDQSIFQADKIEDIITEWMLTTKFQTVNFATSQIIPQSVFRLGHVVT